MDYQRVTPKARQGTTGMFLEQDIGVQEAVVVTPPDRVAAVTVSVHIPEGATAKYKIQASCSSTEKIGNGSGGYWDNLDDDTPTYTKSKNVMIANAVTGIRVLCEDITENYKLNVCFVG